MSSTLFLIPNAIEDQVFGFLPSYIGPASAHVRLIFAEEPKSARALLKHLNPNVPVRDCRILDLNEHTTPKIIEQYMDMLKHEDAAIISEAGCPCVADPGSELVALAHKNDVTVVPFVGPSSILLALMASGLNGQSFAFNGYLPKGAEERRTKIKALALRIQQEGQTQIVMDTPYRNQAMCDDLLTYVHTELMLCIAYNLAGKDCWIRTKSIKQWQKHKPQLEKKPALFLIGRP